MRLDAKHISLAEFKAAHENNFSVLLPAIQTFAEAHGLRLSHSFDRDPLGPHACYFCGWPLENYRDRFIRICVQDPFEPGKDFFIDAEARHFHQRWLYSKDRGLDELRSILENAWLILDKR